MRNFSSKKKGSYSQTSRHRGVVPIILTLCTALLLLYFFTTQLGTLARVVSIPFYSAQRWFLVSESALPVYLRGMHALRVENEHLKEVVAEYADAQTELAVLRHDTNELFALLENVHDDDRGIVAGVLSAPPLSPYDILVIDRGTNHGVAKGDVVYHHGNRAIGIVQKVFDDSSLVTLFSSSESHVSAYLANAKMFVHAYGMGGDVLRLSVPQDVPVVIGEPVLLAGVRGGYLGRVEVVDEDKSRAEKSAYIAPASSNTYRFVRVARTAASNMTREEIRAQIHAEAAYLLSTSTPNDEPVDAEATSTAKDLE